MENKGNKTRTFILLILFAVLAILLLIRSVSLSGDSSTVYADPVVSERNIRGTIYDRHGTPLAYDTEIYGLMVTDIEKAGEASSFINSHITETPVSVLPAINDGTLFFPLSQESFESKEKAEEEIMRSNLRSVVQLRKRRVRTSPYTSLESILGSSSTQYSGEGGIEELFNSYLSAVPALNTDEVYGEDLVLTIDLNYQQLLSDVLSSSHYYGNAAILNMKGEIIAWYGETDDALLSSLCYSHSTRQQTLLFSRTKYISEEECHRALSFFIYISDGNGTVLDAVRRELGDYS